MKRIFLVRHGRTSFNEQRKYTGQMDIDVDEEGIRQARELAANLQGSPVDLVYTSDLMRAQTTARILIQPRDIEMISDRRLREVDFGRWTGLTFAEVKSRYAGTQERWLKDPVHTAPDEGESLALLQSRVKAFINEILAGAPDQTTILAVTHAGPIKAILSYVLGMDLKRYWQFKVGNCSLTIIDYFEGEKGILCQLFNPDILKYAGGN